ncbi:hypothetical protein GCM10022224_054280 [Nonomuraea antimicrobica]|uniref:Uncharacterized protein n=1 Tax=Nonomuraea antimicrobica TaxID=561173 RepID=A0ABP7CAS8_9ACTN
MVPKPAFIEAPWTFTGGRFLACGLLESVDDAPHPALARMAAAAAQVRTVTQ